MSKFTINYEILLRKGLTIRQSLLLFYIHNKDIDGAVEYCRRCEPFNIIDFEVLKRQGYVTFKYENDYTISEEDKYAKAQRLSSYASTDQYDNFIINDIAVDSSWIDEWIDLWPRGVKSGGYFVKSSKSACDKKMRNFIKNTSYDKDIIMKATKLYLDDMERKQYAYIKLAHYFISKDGVSTLESFCDAVNDGVDDVSSLTVSSEDL